MSLRIVERYWQAQDPYDGATLGDLRHPGWVADWPQSAERIPSHAADVAIHTSYPDYPEHRLGRKTGSEEVWRPIASPLMFIPVRITGASDFWIAEAHLEYPEQGLWHAVATLELTGGLISHETVYYCRSLESPPWQDDYPEQGPSKLSPISVSSEHHPEAERQHRTAFERFLDLAGDDPSAAARTLFHDDAVLDRPQMGRRVTGIEGIERAFAAQQPILPGQLRRLDTSGHVLLAESRVTHGDQPWFVITIAEFAGDKVARATEYLAETYPAPDSRKAWVQRLTD